MRSTRVAAAINAATAAEAAAAPGLPQNLQQAVQRLQQLRDKPLTDYTQGSIETAAGIRHSMSIHWEVLDALGGLDSAIEEQLFQALTLTLDVMVRVLLQAPAAVATDTPRHADSDGGSVSSSSSSSSSSSTGSSGKPQAIPRLLAVGELLVLLEHLVAACTSCLPCLADHGQRVACVINDSGGFTVLSTVQPNAAECSQKQPNAAQLEQFCMNYAMTLSQVAWVLATVPMRSYTAGCKCVADRSTCQSLVGCASSAS
jgi:hypothetical protein